MRDQDHALVAQLRRRWGGPSPSVRSGSGPAGRAGTHRRTGAERPSRSRASGTLPFGRRGRSATKSGNRAWRCGRRPARHERRAREARAVPIRGCDGRLRYPLRGEAAVEVGHARSPPPSSSRYHFTRRAPDSASRSRSSASTSGSRRRRRISSGEPFPARSASPASVSRDRTVSAGYCHVSSRRRKATARETRDAVDPELLGRPVQLVHGPAQLARPRPVPGYAGHRTGPRAPYRAGSRPWTGQPGIPDIVTGNRTGRTAGPGSVRTPPPVFRPRPCRPGRGALPAPPEVAAGRDAA